MKFSIIIPVYNVEQYLEKCLLSVVEQNYHDYEIIIVIDGATDGSQEIAENIKKRYPEKNIQIICQENKGLGGARNTGMQYASGDYWLFVDSDDYLDSHALETLAKVTANDKYDMILNKYLLDFFNNYHLDQLDISIIKDYFISLLDQGLSSSVVQSIKNVLKAIYITYENQYGLNHIDFSLVKIEQGKKENASLLDEQFNQLHQYCLNTIDAIHLGILLAMDTGMMIGEICALKWSDINVTDGILTVNRTIERIYIIEGEKKHTELVINTPKTKNSCREIPMNKELLGMLKPLKKVVNDDYYILTNDERPTEPRTYRNYYKRVMEKLDIPKLKYHGLRHSFATRCIEVGCDYKTVSVLLGHSNISTTLNLYVHPNMEQKKRCIDKVFKSLGK